MLIKTYTLYLKATPDQFTRVLIPMNKLSFMDIDSCILYRNAVLSKMVISCQVLVIIVFLPFDTFTNILKCTFYM